MATELGLKSVNDLLKKKKNKTLTCKVCFSCEKHKVTKSKRSNLMFEKCSGETKIEKIKGKAEHFLTMCTAFPSFL